MKTWKRSGGGMAGMAVAVLLAGLMQPCSAHMARLVLKAGGMVEGDARYMAASRSFEVRRGNVTQQVRADDVAQIILAQPPADLNAAVRAVQDGNYQQPIPVLERIARDYAMFGPDVTASHALALAYLRTNRMKQALDTCEALMRTNPSAAQNAGFAGVYWEALLAENRISKLRTSLSDAVQTGDRALAATALVRRGDLEIKENDARAALLNGYLRAVLLFRDVAEIQPEALYKAMKAHEALNEVHYAERWRRRLLSGYGTSEFAKRVSK